MKRLALALACGAVFGAGFFLVGCSVGPKYQRASVPTPPAWKTEGPWREAAPKDAVPKSAWWEIFHDDELNGYEQQLLKANQSLEAARDRLNQARALARVASAGLLPTLSADPAASRDRYSGNRPESSVPVAPLTQSVYEVPFALNYEVDLFGKARKTLQAANASLQGTAADLGNVQLVLTAELAADYFNLRELDAETQVVQESVKIQQEGLVLVKHRHEGGVASGLDLAQQQTLLDSTNTQLFLLQQQRAQFEHAMAALTGTPASTFSVPVAPLNGTPPPVPLGMPSDLLERRPDVATAERPWRKKTRSWAWPRPRSTRNSPSPGRAASRAFRWALSSLPRAHSGRWAEISCSPFLTVAVIAPISPPPNPPMTDPSPTTANPLSTLSSRWRMDCRA